MWRSLFRAASQLPLQTLRRHQLEASILSRELEAGSADPPAAAAENIQGPAASSRTRLGAHLTEPRPQVRAPLRAFETFGHLIVSRP
jgi:hypothetical protein